MSQREIDLKAMGVLTGAGSNRGAVGAYDQLNAIPTISGYGEFTPITVRSYTTPRAKNADLESDKR